MKMNFDEQQQQQQQEEERRSPLADSKYMLSEEIEMIIRTQLAQLNVQNPYFEDYYYFTFMAKKSKRRKTKNKNSNLPLFFMQTPTKLEFSHRISTS